MLKKNHTNSQYEGHTYSTSNIYADCIHEYERTSYYTPSLLYSMSEYMHGLEWPTLRRGFGEWLRVALTTRPVMPSPMII